jgi:hypothetical protein
VFTFGYVQAMRTTMLLPVILLAVGAVSCLALKQPAPQRDAGHDSPSAEDVRPAEDMQPAEDVGRPGLTTSPR